METERLNAIHRGAVAPRRSLCANPHSNTAGRRWASVFSLLLVGTALVGCEDDSVTAPVSDVTEEAAQELTSQPNFFFHSDWSTATGTSRQALLDMSKADPWDATKGDSNGGARVTNSVRWPDGIANALTISHVSGNDNPGVRLSGSLPLFTSGKRGYRFYIKNVLPDNHRMGDDSAHPFQDGAGGSNTNWQFNIEDNGDGTWTPSFEFPNSDCRDCEGTRYRHFTLAAGCMRGSRCSVPKDSVYRFEMLLTHHSTANSMDIDIRMYNADGTLRAGPEDWHRVMGGGTSADRIWYSIPNRSSFRDLQIGTNGWGGGRTSTRYVAWHWGGVAVCNDWCGRYNRGK